MTHRDSTNAVSLLIALILVCSLVTQALQAKSDVLTNISADYVAVVDQKSGKLICERNAEEQMYPASLTKMMTAILAIEEFPDLSPRITVTSEMLNGLKMSDASVAGFQVGDQPTVEDLLYGISLSSGADACNALAIAHFGSTVPFVMQMNGKAKELGMTSTHFANVTGLHDADNYTTAKDMAKLVQYCVKNKTFVKIFSADSYTTSSLLSAPNGIHMYSMVRYLAAMHGLSLPGLIGAKTGYTVPAGRCLACWANANGRPIIVVVAHVTDNEDGSSAIYDVNTILKSLERTRYEA